MRFQERIDEAALEAADPDLILTQELCAVCAVSYREVNEVARAIPAWPRPQRPLPQRPLAHQRGDQRSGGPWNADAGPAHLAERLGESDDIGRRNVEGSGHFIARHQPQRIDGVAGVQKLQPRIKTHGSRHHRE